MEYRLLTHQIDEEMILTMNTVTCKCMHSKNKYKAVKNLKTCLHTMWNCW